MPMITGDILMGPQRVPGRERSFRAVNPATGETLEPAFAFAGPTEVERACNLAWDAFQSYRATGLEERARFLESIAANIIELGDELVERARPRPARRSAQTLRRGGARGRMPRSAHRPRPARAQAAAAPGPTAAQHP